MPGRSNRVVQLGQFRAQVISAQINAAQAADNESDVEANALTDARGHLPGVGVYARNSMARHTHEGHGC